MIGETRERPAALGFRRDVTLFLSALVGFFVILILVLLLLLQLLVERTTEIAQGQWRRVARIAAQQIDLAAAGPGSALESTLARIRSDLDIAAIELERAGRPVVSGRIDPERSGAVSIRTQLGPATFRFDRSALDDLHRRYVWTAAISLLAAIAGTILMLFYVRKISRPIEDLLAQAGLVRERGAEVDETRYLLDTFRTTIDTLRDQEVELRQLHDHQKARADDLARVTAALTRSLTSGFLSLDADGRLVDVNEAGREILGWRGADLGGKTPREALGDHEFARVVEGDALERRAQNRREVTLEAAGRTRLVGLTTVPLLDEDDRYLGLLALFTDLTPFRELERRVADLRALADLGEISAGIAHEFRNSLSTVLGYLKLARRSPLPEEVEAKVRSAQEEATLLADAVTALLSFARPMELSIAPFSLRELAASVLRRLEEYAGPSVRTRLDGPDVELSGDASLVSRALENVIRNAIEAVHRRDGAGTVSVTLSESPVATLIVEDDGVGISPEEIASAFVPFRSGRPGGFGLGLALSRKIVLLHGGSIVLERGTEGGARVRMEFPGGGITERETNRP
ncbi:MAG TPA: ATP-binding protein [Thermoanaerobaculia bacterium]|nr:ATP-binding protein [Thermoanaerobaculia bacterium]